MLTNRFRRSGRERIALLPPKRLERAAYIVPAKSAQGACRQASRLILTREIGRKALRQGAGRTCLERVPGRQLALGPVTSLGPGSHVWQHVTACQRPSPTTHPPGRQACLGLAACKRAANTYKKQLLNQ